MLVMVTYKSRGFWSNRHLNVMASWSLSAPPKSQLPSHRMYVWKGFTVQAARHVLDCSIFYNRVWLSSLHTLDLKRKSKYSTKDKKKQLQFGFGIFFFCRVGWGGVVCLFVCCLNLCHCHRLQNSIVYILICIWKCGSQRIPCQMDVKLKVLSPAIILLTQLPHLYRVHDSFISKVKNPMTLLLNECKYPWSQIPIG